MVLVLIEFKLNRMKPKIECYLAIEEITKDTLTRKISLHISQGVIKKKVPYIRSDGVGSFT